MGIPLSEATLRLVDGKNYAVLATVNPDGSPQTSVVWAGRDGRDLLFSTVEGRVKHRNMVRDPRVSITVIDSSDPENYVELRGRVSMTLDVGRRVDTQLSWKYDGKDPGRTGLARSAWSCGWWWRRLPGMRHKPRYGSEPEFCLSGQYS